jgi:hypothetical protein
MRLLDLLAGYFSPRSVELRKIKGYEKKLLGHRCLFVIAEDDIRKARREGQLAHVTDTLNTVKNEIQQIDAFLNSPATLCSPAQMERTIAIRILHEDLDLTTGLLEKIVEMAIEKATLLRSIHSSGA